MATKKVRYSEPVDFIPKNIRKELGLGEFAPEAAPKSAGNSGKNKPAGKKAK